MLCFKFDCMGETPNKKTNYVKLLIRISSFTMQNIVKQRHSQEKFI